MSITDKTVNRQEPDDEINVHTGATGVKGQSALVSPAGQI